MFVILEGLPDTPGRSFETQYLIRKADWAVCDDSPVIVQVTSQGRAQIVFMLLYLSQQSECHMQVLIFRPGLC